MSLVRLEKTDGWATVTLARPERRNAINAELARDFAAAVDDIVAAGVHSAVLGAEGPVFCAGADLKDLREGRRAVQSVLDVLTHAPVHWTAKIAAPVVGAGVSMVAACPRAVVTPDAYFVLPEMKHGFFPTDLMAGLGSVIGLKQAFTLGFSSSPIDAGESVRLGLATAVESADGLDARVRDEAARIAASAHEAVLDGVAAWQSAIRGSFLS